MERFLLPEEKLRFGIPVVAGGRRSPSQVSVRSVSSAEADAGTVPIRQSTDALQAMVALFANPERVPTREVRSGVEAAIHIATSAVELSTAVDKAKARRALRAMARRIRAICEGDCHLAARTHQMNALKDDLSTLVRCVPANAPANCVPSPKVGRPTLL